MVMRPTSPNIRAVVFDLDDTIYPERDYVLSGYAAISRYLADKLRRRDRFDDWLAQRFLAGRTAGAFDALNEHFKLGLESEQIQELVAIYRGHLPIIHPHGGMIEFLGRLRERFALGLLSDGFLPAQSLKVQALRIERFFDAILFTQEYGPEAWKPCLKCFEIIAGKLGAPNEQCAYVGDNPAKDFVAANALGWLSIQFCRTGQVHSHKPAPPGGEPAVIVRDLEELHKALRQ